MSIGNLMVDIAGISLTDADIPILTHPRVGGIILFARNYQSPQQLQQLIKHIRATNANLLIAVDQEGGRVQRFKTGFTPLPSMAQLGNIYDRDQALGCQLAQDCGWLMAVELLAQGVDFSFAPVLDLANFDNPVVADRAFHHQPEIVAQLAEAFVAGMSRAGMATVGKHYPGHGSVTADSHDDKAVCLWHANDARLQAALYPFTQLIKANIAAIMPAHICFPYCDKQAVVCSSYWLQTVLRQQLDFQGAIFSDDMNMVGAAVAGDYLSRCQLALTAGCDMVLLCNNRPAVLTVLSTLDDQHDCHSQSRLVAMRAQQHYDPQSLSASHKWQQARKAVNSINRG